MISSNVSTTAEVDLPGSSSKMTEGADIRDDGSNDNNSRDEAGRRNSDGSPMGTSHGNQGSPEVEKNQQHLKSSSLAAAAAAHAHVLRGKSKTPPPTMMTDLEGGRDGLLLEDPTITQLKLKDVQQAGYGDCPEVGCPSRRHLKSSSLPHGVKLCSEVTRPTEPSSSQVPGKPEGGEEDEEGDDKWVVLEAELRKAQSELKAKDAEVEKLKGIRQQVEGELTDLTAALFEEAHKMVQEAKMKEVTSEKNLREAKMQLDGLQAEVAALKTLLITSTPSRPNLCNGSSSNGISIFKKQHKRYPSHNHLQYGRSEDETDSSKMKSGDRAGTHGGGIDQTRCSVDPILHGMFAKWREEPTLTLNHNNNSKSPFLERIYAEDIIPCLTFPNESLVVRLRRAVEENSIWVEPVPEKDKSNVPTACALVCSPRTCHYRMRFSYDSEEWFTISQLCRDRIAAVCEFLNYLRYIKNGLVKASVDDAYWEVIRLRKQIALAKLGIPIE